MGGSRDRSLPAPTLLWSLASSSQTNTLRCQNCRFYLQKTEKTNVQSKRSLQSGQNFLMPAGQTTSLRVPGWSAGTDCDSFDVSNAMFLWGWLQWGRLSQANACSTSPIMDGNESVGEDINVNTDNEFLNILYKQQLYLYGFVSFSHNKSIFVNKQKIILPIVVGGPLILFFELGKSEE